ncbi:hypothetical protein ACHAWU_002066 [Discostella pseudostelligera]|uniref:Uncharacterized protein n=1 Tax=Discostella pseudostelligera TaxID=259834 RepID=A0ABD3M5F6_9STRA
MFSLAQGIISVSIMVDVVGRRSELERYLLVFHVGTGKLLSCIGGGPYAPPYPAILPNVGGGPTLAPYKRRSQYGSIPALTKLVAPTLLFP